MSKISLKSGQKPNYFFEDRPWGQFVNLAQNTACTVKILYVNPGECLSLQVHQKRDQFYILLDGGFTISEGDVTHQETREGDAFYFPRGTVHRAQYHGARAFGRILDIAFGENDESDITRLTDKYGRT